LRFSGIQLPRQAKADTNQGPAVLGALASGPCLEPIIKPAVFNGSPPKGRRTAVKNTDETFFRHETCLKKIAPKFHSDMMRSKKQQDDSHKTNCKTAAKNWTAIPF